MKRKLIAVAITLILVLSAIVPVYAGPDGGGSDPPVIGLPRGRSIALPITLTICIEYCNCNTPLCECDLPE
ncbi:MAG: hypothetical protein FWE11_10370 [Defluviitaleaceae bacterium]|nr:hypothetical protein [Defluviitaleaceae bacterium]